MYRLVIEIREAGPTPRGMKRAVGNAFKEAYDVTGRHWQQTMLPKHFTRAGAREYGYTPRKGEQSGTGKGFWRTYTGRKQKYLGHTRPLVYSGASETLAMRGIVRATRKQAVVPIPAPTLNYKPPRSSINMRQEVTTVSDREIPDLVRVFEQELHRRLEAVGYYEKTKA